MSLCVARLLSGKLLYFLVGLTYRQAQGRTSNKLYSLGQIGRGAVVWVRILVGAIKILSLRRTRKFRILISPPPPRYVLDRVYYIIPGVSSRMIPIKLYRITIYYKCRLERRSSRRVRKRV